MTNQTTYLLKADYEPMDAIPPVYKKDSMTAIRTDMELNEGDCIQWFAQRQVKPYDHQWYKIIEVRNKKTNSKHILGKYRYELLVELADVTDKSVATIEVAQEEQ